LRGGPVAKVQLCMHGQVCLPLWECGEGSLEKGNFLLWVKAEVQRKSCLFGQHAFASSRWHLLRCTRVALQVPVQGRDIACQAVEQCRPFHGSSPAPSKMLCQNVSSCFVYEVRVCLKGIESSENPLCLSVPVLLARSSTFGRRLLAVLLDLGSGNFGFLWCAHNRSLTRTSFFPSWDCNFVESMEEGVAKGALYLWFGL